MKTRPCNNISWLLKTFKSFDMAMMNFMRSKIQWIWFLSDSTFVLFILALYLKVISWDCTFIWDFKSICNKSVISIASYLTFSNVCLKLNFSSFISFRSFSWSSSNSFWSWKRRANYTNEYYKLTQATDKQKNWLKDLNWSSINYNFSVKNNLLNATSCET